MIGGVILDILTKLAITLAIGFVFGKAARALKLPNVSGYLIGGLLISPSLFGIFNNDELNSLTFISEIALSFIAFSIGSEFVISEMKKYGKKVFIITLAEVLGAVLIVFSVMYFILKQDFVFSIIIASMSAATAPAATLLVMRQYRAYGPVTKTLLPVVALDDVFGIIIFGIAMALSKVKLSGEVSVLQMIYLPLKEILGSLALGVIIGLLLSVITRKMNIRDDLQILSLIAVFIGIGLSNLFGFSSLLTNIVIGTTLVNLMPRANKVFDSVNDLSTPFYLLFFTLAGASLDLSVLVTVGIIGIVYIFCRGIGKYLGAWIGGRAVKAEKTVQKYLGLGLLPQGGVSIGLSVLVRQQLPEYAVPITTIIMFSVLIYETLGPIFGKAAISLAGEINGLDRKDQEIVPEGGITS